MIKKIVLTVSIIILSLFINTNVHADEAIRNYQLIYDIIELNISDTDITFDGWAFINDIDNNKRIDSSKPNTYKNITMSIVAKQYNNKTKKNVDILEIPVESYNGKYNKYLYESNCMKWSSEENSNELSECIENYESSSCDITYKNGKQITVIPSCRQDDIGFNVKVNIAKVKSKIINNTPVYFYLRVYDKEKLSGKEVWEKSIGVNTQSVKGKTNNNQPSGSAEHDVHNAHISDDCTNPLHRAAKRGHARYKDARPEQNLPEIIRTTYDAEKSRIDETLRILFLRNTLLDVGSTLQNNSAGHNHRTDQCNNIRRAPVAEPEEYR